MILAGSNIPLVFNHPTKQTDRYVRARVWNASGSELGSSPYALTHLANGVYRNLSVAMPTTDFLIVQYECFTDAGYTTPDSVSTVDMIIYKKDASSGSGSESDAAYERIIGVVSGDEIIGKVQEVS